MYKAGKITLVAPSLGVVLAVNGTASWFVLQNRRGQFIAGPEQPELIKAADGTAMLLPKQSEVIYFLQDESEPSAVKLWATKQEYEATQLFIKQQHEAAQALIKQQEEEKKRLEDLAARPKIRFMQQVVKENENVGEPTVVPPGEMFLHDFLKKYPVDRYDRFTTSGEFRQKLVRWPETLTKDGWVRMEKDPRKKT